MTLKMAEKAKKLYKPSKIILIVSAILTILSLGWPMLAKNMSLSSLGQQTIAEMQAFSLALEYLGGEEVLPLAAGRENKKTSEDLSALLTAVSAKDGYAGISLISRSNTNRKEYIVLADSYNKNGAVYLGQSNPIGSIYSLETYKGAKSILDNLYSKKRESGYVNDVINARDGSAVSSAYLPVFYQGEILGVLAIDALPKTINFHMIGPLNLNYLGGVYFLITLIALAVVLLIKKFALTKENIEPDETNPTTEEIDALEGDDTDEEGTPEALKIEDNTDVINAIAMKQEQDK